MKKYLKLFRVTHYLKNLLIFVPIFFAEHLYDWRQVCYLIFMIVPFCLASSAIYVINDIKDADKDRMHPQKCKRPIASGAISKKSAKMALVILIAVSILMVSITIPMGLFCWQAAVLLILYFSINFGYSNGLKNIPIMDIALLASGYLIRLFYGASLVNVAVSPWLYLTVMAGAFYLGMGKRRNEMKNISGGNTRMVLNKYNYEFLDKNMHVCLGLSIAFYSLWAIQTDYVGMIWTIPLILLILMKYSLDIEDDNAEGDPMKVVINDKVLLIMGASYFTMVFLIIYLL